MRQKSDPGPKTGATTQNHHTSSHHEVDRRSTFDFTARISAVAAVAWRYKAAAKQQAQHGIIDWATFRRFCAEVDRITRARLTKVQATVDQHIATAPSDTWEGTRALMRAPRRKPRKGQGSRTEGDVKDCRLDHEYRQRRDAAIRGSLRCSPLLTTEEHAQRLGLAPEIVTEIRKSEESGESEKIRRRNLVADALRQTPHLTDRELGRRCGVDHKTIAAHRRRMISAAEIIDSQHRVDPRSGKRSQPAHRVNRRTKSWDVENFLIDFVAANADERGEVAARDCIRAAEAAGIPESALTKARFINRDLIGSRKAGRRDGWVWYPITALYQDSSRAESSFSGFGERFEPNPADWPQVAAVVGW